MLFTLTLLLLVPNLTAAELTEDAGKIEHQVSKSDRIMIGTVSQIDIYYNYTIYTIMVKEWLYNPLPIETIKVKTEIGTNVWTEDEAEFTQNESALLMLRDKDSSKQLFTVTFGFPGKRSVWDRDAVIKELKAQGKWQEENQTSNDTGNTGASNERGNTGAAKTTKADVEQEENLSSTQKSNPIPFISPFWALLMVLGAVMYMKRK